MYFFLLFFQYLSDVFFFIKDKQYYCIKNIAPRSVRK